MGGGSGAAPDDTRFIEGRERHRLANAVKAGHQADRVRYRRRRHQRGSGRNLRAIFGTVPNSDYYQTSVRGRRSSAQALALGNCTVPSPSSSSSCRRPPPPATAGAQSPTTPWTFTRTPTTGAPVTVKAPNVGTTATDGTGAVDFPLTFTGTATSGNVTFVETPQTGYAIHQGVLNQNAVCTNTAPKPTSCRDVANGSTGDGDRDPLTVFPIR